MKKYIKKNKHTIFLLILFAIISIISIYSFTPYLKNETYSATKQFLFYLFSFFLIFIISKTNNKIIIKYIFVFYVINLFLLILVLFLGAEINSTKAWFQIPFLGSFQPSEFMKISLIILESKIVSKTTIKTYKDELKLILVLFLLTIMPSIFTFLEPDTGAIIIYFIIFFSIIYSSNIRNRWLIIFITIIISLISIILYLYLNNQNLFIKIFSSSLFYRLDRIFDFVNKSGMQLENSIIAIGSSNIFGKGILNIPIYYPEGHTDFIFTSIITTFGLFGGIILIVLLVIFDIKFIKESNKEKGIYKYIIFSFVSVVIFQQIENISMTMGLLPIMGITLPFISYGGSSLISFSIILGIIMNKKE